MFIRLPHVRWISRVGSTKGYHVAAEDGGNSRPAGVRFGANARRGERNHRDDDGDVRGRDLYERGGQLEHRDAC
jgi:hypothetical protein